MTEETTAYVTNRELSWVLFNERVLNEALEDEFSVFDRLKFIAITSSNLDEFLRVRVAKLKEKKHENSKERDDAGLTVSEQLTSVHQSIKKLVERQYRIYEENLLPLLEAEGIFMATRNDSFSAEEMAYLRGVFKKEIRPHLSLHFIDETDELAMVKTNALYMIAPTEDGYVIVSLSHLKHRLIAFSEHRVICAEELLFLFANDLKISFDATKMTLFRVLRSASLHTDDDEFYDISHIETELKQRRTGDVVSLQIETSVPEEILSFLQGQFLLSPEEIYLSKSPLDFQFLYELYAFDHTKKTMYEKFQPKMPYHLANNESLFRRIRKGDIFLFHPYDCFVPVVDFIKCAALDDQVVSIKQTLYRLGEDSPIVTWLLKAKERGKEVTVLVELKARFDEANNVSVARELESAGVRVLYGFQHLKTHCKITLVKRREKDELRYYTHLATGNYNYTTAKLYTDCGILTYRQEFGADADALFSYLAKDQADVSFQKFLVAPFSLRDSLCTLIDDEIAEARNGHRARIVAKMNALCDRALIEKLYEASKSGVEITLIVRGICTLRAGVEGLSEHIRVLSIVGNYLEHSRIFYFAHGGEEKYFLSSADWMPRNMDRRIEIAFPIESKRIKKRLSYILHVLCADNKKAYEMQSDGSYARIRKKGDSSVEAQAVFCETVFEDE